MSDNNVVTNPDAVWFGIKITYAIAGFWGGIMSLSFVRGLTFGQGLMAVITGLFSAIYLTPIFSIWILDKVQPSDDVYEMKARAIAFIVGLTAMNIIPGFIKLSEIWKNRPTMFLKGIQNGNDTE